MKSPYYLAKQFQVRFKKQLGQNFLSHPPTAEMIVQRAGIQPTDTVLEIGPGFGALTIAAARMAERLIAIETDREVIPVLESELAANQIENVTILRQNILQTDFSGLAEEHGGSLVVLGNLPYNISSQILIRLITFKPVIARAILMFQKELAQRIMAPPSCKDYGRLSVMLQYLADIRPIARIKAHLFSPKPKVDSEVIEITFKKQIHYPTLDEDLLFQVIKAGFGKRRKNLKNALSGSELHLSPNSALALLEQAGIAPHRRAESLTVSEFVDLSNCLYHLPESEKNLGR